MGFNPRFPDPFEDSVRRSQERVRGHEGIPQRSFVASVLVLVVGLVRVIFKAVRFLLKRLWWAVTWMIGR